MAPMATTGHRKHHPCNEAHARAGSKLFEGHGDLGFADHLVCRENSACTVMSGLTEAWASRLLQTEVMVTSHSARPGAESRGTHLMSHWHTAAKGPRDLQLSQGGNTPLGMRASPRLGLGT